MRRKRLLASLLLLSVCGCSCMNNTERGAVGGGIVGGALGTAVGVMTGRPLAGAAIGAGLGAGIGAVDGNVQDRREQRYANQVAAVNAQAARNQMTLNEIVQMTQQQVPDHTIINAINTSGSVFNLRPDDIIYLQQQNVSNRVITEMQRHTVRPVIVQPRTIERVVIVEPPPPPPPHFGVGVMIGR